MRASVAMAAYNGEAYIKEQVCSVLGQLDADDELVVSLDPSRDRTEEIIRSLNDARIRIVPGPGKGILANFENALRNCSGDILFLCDQDDVWKEDKKAKVMKAFEDPEVVLAMHDAAVTDQDLKVLQPSFFALKGTKTGYWANLVKNRFIGCCMAFRKELLDTVLPFPSDIPMHDQWIGCLACKKGKVVLIPEALLLYRRHGDNASSDHHASLPQMIRWRLTMIKRLSARLGGRI